MTARFALSVLSRAALESPCEPEEKLHRLSAISSVADALRFAPEADKARLAAEALIASDRSQLQLFQLLEAEEGGGNGRAES